MELYQLEYFRVLAKCKSFTQTANKFSVTQPAVSASIRKLEEELGTPLIDRIDRKLVLTPAGESILAHIELIHDNVVNIQTDAAQYAQSAVESVSLALPLSSGSELAFLIPCEFLKKHSNFTVNLQQMGPRHIVEQIDSGNIDFGISCMDISRSSLETEYIYTVELAAHFSPEHEFNQYTSITPKLLENQPIFLGKDAGGIDRSICTYMENNHISPKYLYVGALTPTNSIHLSITGMGIALCAVTPQSQYYARLDPPLYVKFAIMWRKGRKLTPNQKKLIHFMKNVYASEGLNK